MTEKNLDRGNKIIVQIREIISELEQLEGIYHQDILIKSRDGSYFNANSVLSIGELSEFRNRVIAAAKNKIIQLNKEFNEL